MTEQPQSGGQFVLLLALLDFLAIEDNREVKAAVQAFKELLKKVDPYSSFNLLRLKLKALAKMRDEALLKELGPAGEGAAAEVAPAVRELLERALELLESVGKTSGAFSDKLAAAIDDLKKAKDMVSLERISKRLIDSGTEMMHAANAFQNNLGEIAHVMSDYERRIRELESQVEKHKEEARNDQLTGILNRGAFDRRFVQEAAHARRFRSPLCLFLVDLDFFKKINDQYGHQVGDDVLLNFAKLLSKVAGTRDLAFRFGGDEFAVLFPNKELDEVKVVTDRLQRYVRENAYRFEGVKFNMGLSGGVARMREGESHDDFFKRADQQLYQAKQQGRGRVCVDPD